MAPTGIVHVSDGVEFSGRRVVEFRALDRANIVFSASDEHLSISNECSRMALPRSDQVSSRREGTFSGIVQLRRGQTFEIISTTCDEHHSVWKKRSRVPGAGCGHATGRGQSRLCRKYDTETETIRLSKGSV